MRSGWIAVALTLALACLAADPVAAQDKPIELKFSSWLAVVHGHHTGVMVPWAKMVEEKSGGRLKITIYPGSVLGKPADHYDMIKDGIADLGFTTPGYTPGRFPLITVTALPLGMFKSSRGGSLAVMSIFDKYFKNEFKDVKVLWFWVHPPGHFHLAKKQVKVLEDLQGLHLSVGGDLVLQDRRGAQASCVLGHLRRPPLHVHEPEEIRQPPSRPS